MAVLVLRIVHVLQPLLQLAVPSDLHGRQPVEHLRQRIAESGIIAHNLRSLQSIVQGIKHYLVVHRTTCRYRTVLGRHRRSHHPPFVRRMLGQEIQKETGRAFQYRIISFQELFVGSEQVVLPQMLGQPCPSTRPHAGRCKIHHAADAPQVGIVMGHPSSAIVHVTSCLRPRHGQVFQHGEQGLVHLTQVGHLGQPIVHLSVDIDGVFAVPRSIRTAVPNALQISRLPAGLGRGNQQITAILEQKRSQRRISTLTEIADT